VRRTSYAYFAHPPDSNADTLFSRDVLGRYVCNTFSEAMAAQNPSLEGQTDARPFDVIVVGGGSFAGTFAQHLMTVDVGRRHRILVLEAGPMLVGEHVQNLPMIGLSDPGTGGATTLDALQAAGKADKPGLEVWGLSWRSAVAFPGLAYCVGGRSLYWGGWSPQPLPEELAGWPQAVVTDLSSPQGFEAAARQLGSDSTNDFIYGPLQNVLRRVLTDANGGITHAMSPAMLPDHPAVAALPPGTTADDVARVLGLENAGGRTLRQLKNEAKLEAPLAVQATARAGYFPGNKFSSGPLIVKASRTAWGEWPREDNLRRRLMLIPNCHVQQLVHDGSRVTAVRTNLGDVEVKQDAVVGIAAGTIESSRLAKNSFQGLPQTAAIGTGLTAHLRSNLTIRIPRTSLPTNPPVAELSEAALFLKGRHTNQSDRYFHLQITAAGLGPQGNSSEAELWQKIPDIDTLDRFKTASDSHVVITMRGIGEMDTDNAASFVRESAGDLDYGTPRALVGLAASARDQEVWTAMDECSDDVALAFAGGKDYEVLAADGWKLVTAGASPSTKRPHASRHDGLGTTHHEAASLRMGTDPNVSAVDADGRLHAVSNAYVLGPAVFPRLGSPNPMLTGVALSRRLAEHLALKPGPQPDNQPGEALPYVPGDGYQVLFDGVDTSKWRFAGSGSFPLVDGALVSEPGGDLGLSWCTTPTPANYRFRLQFRLSQQDDNAGVFVRFPNPDGKGYNNPAWVPVHFGFEVQIDDLARPDGADNHRTGSIYGIPNPNYNRVTCRPPGQWNDLEIDVVNQTYTVSLNGTQSTKVTNTIQGRGMASTAAMPSFIGLQSHTGRVSFRHMRIEARP
jgi:choline dehydrogenase-like flavoprotein